MTQPKRLSHDVRMQRNAGYERLCGRLHQHFFQLVDDHFSKFTGSGFSNHNCGNVVDLLWVGDRQQWPVFGIEPGGPIIVAPIENIVVAFGFQEIGGLKAFGNPRPQPALRTLAFMPRNRGRGFLNERASPSGLKDDWRSLLVRP